MKQLQYKKTPNINNDSNNNNNKKSQLLIPMAPAGFWPLGNKYLLKKRKYDKL